ncbi:hypothetical protein, partial [Lentilactobacillus parafarraginis]|uniref:hypothetical protein n=1 Tax=Lentilactobacillus parafarraginis TaxID=390842 RepID=UPI000ADEC578
KACFKTDPNLFHHPNLKRLAFLPCTSNQKQIVTESCGTELNTVEAQLNYLVYLVYIVYTN